MSAYLCNPTHVGALAAYLFKLPNREHHIRRILETGGEEGDAPPLLDAQLAAVLADANVRSVAYRYPDVVAGERPGPVGIETDGDYLLACIDAAGRLLDAYSPRPRARDFRPVEILKAADCYEYQCCEDPGWKDSTARRLIDLLRACAIQDLPGYDAAPWDWTSAAGLEPAR